MKRSPAIGILALLTLTACEGLKEAMTAHVDVVARAGSQSLSVERLATLIGKSQFPLQPDFAKAVAGVWVNYQLLGKAAAHNDSLNDPKAVEDALWGMIAESRVMKWHERATRNAPGYDSTANRSRFDQGDVLAARHILFRTTEQMTPAQRDSVRRMAESVRSRVTGANFAPMARQYGQDNTREQGGDLGVFPRGNMVKDFENAVLALRPGQISPSLVQTQFGYHIVRRSTYDETRAEVGRALQGRSQQVQDSAIVDNLVKSAEVKWRDDAVRTAKSAAKDLDSHRDDRSVLATSKIGPLTIGKMVRWLSAAPNRQQIEQTIQQAPDSVVKSFLESIMRNELLLHAADTAKVQADTAQMMQLRQMFVSVVRQAWQQLGVGPAQLADSAASEADRERLAASRVEAYVDQLLAGQGRPVQIPHELEGVLREKYDWNINAAGLERAVERARRIRQVADSTRQADRPQSQVPLGQPGTQPPGGQPQPAQPRPEPPQGGGRP